MKAKTSKLDRVYCPYCVRPVRKTATSCSRCGYDFLLPLTIRDMLAGKGIHEISNDVNLTEWTRLVVDLVLAENS